MRTLSMFATACLLLTCTSLAQIRLRQFNSRTAVVGIGDFDKDGVSDYAVTGNWLVELYSRKTNTLTHTIRGGPYGSPTPARIASADINGDGHADVLVGWPFDRKTGSGGADGVVRIYSGKDASLLREHWSLWPQDTFGFSLDVLGDVNGDKVPDYIIGAPNAPGGNASHGVITVHSGKDGRMLYFATGSSQIHELGWTVAGPGDLDGDGVPDFAASTQQRGLVQCYSGRTGKLIKTLTFSGINTVVSALGDVNGDRHADLVVGAPNRAYVVSGKDWSNLHTLNSFGGRFGTTVLGVGDIDGDMVPDLWVGAPESSSSQTGYAVAFSGRTGRSLLRVQGNASQQWGTELHSAGDFNGDEIDDVSFGSSRNRQCVVYSGGSARALSVDSASVSVGQGGAQTLYLRAGTAQQRKLYLVLGSMAGTSPGLKIGSVQLPLNPDLYFNFTLSAPNTLIASSVGILGNEGEAQARLTIPKGAFSSFAGKRLHHAFLAMNLFPFRVDFASNATFLDLVK